MYAVKDWCTTMLVLTRWIGEKIVIGNEDYFLEVINAGPDRGTSEVKIGISSKKEPKQIIFPVYVGKRISIGENVLIEIIDSYPVKTRTQVRIGIDAPREVSVHRLEIWEKIKNGTPREENSKSGCIVKSEK